MCFHRRLVCKQSSGASAGADVGCAHNKDYIEESDVKPN
jgi:hypothetical protein